MVYGLRYYYRLLGMNKKAIALPFLKQDTKLPIVLNRQEPKMLFAAPTLLKHRIILTLIYSAGLRGQEVIKLKISDIDFERIVIHFRQMYLMSSTRFICWTGGFIATSCSVLPAVRCTASVTRITVVKPEQLQCYTPGGRTFHYIRTCTALFRQPVILYRANGVISANMKIICIRCTS